LIPGIPGAGALGACLMSPVYKKKSPLQTIA